MRTCLTRLLKNRSGSIIIEYVVICSLLVPVFAYMFSHAFYSPKTGYPTKGLAIPRSLFGEKGGGTVTVAPGGDYVRYVQRIVTGIDLPVP